MIYSETNAIGILVIFYRKSKEKNNVKKMMKDDGADDKTCVELILTRSTRVRNHLLANSFFLPFQISNHIRKAFIFNINEGNNQTFENTLSS